MKQYNLFTLDISKDEPSVITEDYKAWYYEDEYKGYMIGRITSDKVPEYNGFGIFKDGELKFVRSSYESAGVYIDVISTLLPL